MGDGWPWVPEVKGSSKPTHPHSAATPARPEAARDEIERPTEATTVIALHRQEPQVSAPVYGELTEILDTPPLSIAHSSERNVVAGRWSLTRRHRCI